MNEKFKYDIRVSNKGNTRIKLTTDMNYVLTRQDVWGLMKDKDLDFDENTPFTIDPLYDWTVYCPPGGNSYEIEAKPSLILHDKQMAYNLSELIRRKFLTSREYANILFILKLNRHEHGCQDHTK